MQAHLEIIVCNFGRNPTICLREKAILGASTKVPVSRDLWPWPWAHPGCAPNWRLSCASLVATRDFCHSRSDLR